VGAVQNQNLHTSALPHNLTQMGQRVTILYQPRILTAHGLLSLSLSHVPRSGLQLMSHPSPVLGDESTVGAEKRREVAVLTYLVGSYHPGDNEQLCVPCLRTCNIWWTGSGNPSENVPARSNHSR
jgi:hypothetical protein